MGIGGIRGHWGTPRGCRDIRDHKGVSGCRGCIGGWHGAPRGCPGHWSGRWAGSPTTLGPNPGSKHSHWFPLGSDLPHQGQTRAPFQGAITPTGFPWGVTYLAKAKQMTEMRSAGYYIHLNYILWQFAYLYLHCLITYSFTQCKEILYRLFSLQTNLCISLHHQSDVLQHHGTYYKELLFL